MNTETVGVKRDNKRKLNIDFSLLGLLVIIIIFFGRCFNIMTNSFDRGAHPYVQMLNFGLPVVEDLVYDEDDFAESTMSLGAVALEAIGISDVGPHTIMTSELPYVKMNMLADGKIEGYEDFKLGDDAVAKYTEEEFKAYDKELKEALKGKKTKILMVNTHGTENYSESKGFTTNENHSVKGVAEVIKKDLKEKYGIEIVYDKTVHDVSYDDAYLRTQETYKKYIDKYGNNFDLIIDIHRDGVKGTNKAPFYTKVNGEGAAKIMFVNSGTSPYFKENDKVAREFIKITDELYPTLNRKKEPLTYYPGKHGLAQQIGKNSILIEVGANTNTSKEAQKTGECIARVIAEYVKNKK
ncbi:MAG: stage II sporulation protein P [Clostridium sp.]|uniref:stage II sporulation protein P n=1 Tax=Clostridium sp. TaxID=1506 RepID=UPI003F2B19DC